MIACPKSHSKGGRAPLHALSQYSFCNTESDGNQMGQLTVGREMNASPLTLASPH